MVPHVSPSASPAASKDSQVLMFEVHSSGKVPVSGAVTRPPAPPTPSQRIVLQPVQTAPSVPSVKCYRRPDGKLVRLVPVPQLMSANPRLPLQRGESGEHRGKIQAASARIPAAETIVYTKYSKCSMFVTTVNE